MPGIVDENIQLAVTIEIPGEDTGNIYRRVSESSATRIPEGSVAVAQEYRNDLARPARTWPDGDKIELAVPVKIAHRHFSVSSRCRNES